MSDITFPAGFEDLAAWSDWCQANFDARRDLRIGSTMEEIEAFYNAMLPRMEAILAHLAATKLDGIDPKSEALMNLSFAMAEVAPAVEQFFEPTISYGYDATRFRQGVR